MSQEQQVTNEELEAYWAKVAHDVDHGINGMPKPDWKKVLHLDWIIEDWKSELVSRGSNPDTF